jgi:hypothetical protein
VSEDLFSKLLPPTSVSRDKRRFWNVLLTASSHNIPSGYRANFVPGLPNSAKVLISERDELRARDPSDPAIPTLNTKIFEAIQTSSCKAWHEKVESSSHKQDPGKFWSLLKTLSGKSTHPPITNPSVLKAKS